MNEKEKLFVETINDLQKRLEARGEYEILGISSLLRKLLIDGNPLLHQINREHKLKMTFEVTIDENFYNNFKDGFPLPDFYSVQDGIDPQTSRPGKNSRSVDLDGLLSTPMMLVNGKTYAIKDMVLFEANVMGGVHAGKPQPEQRQIDQTAKELKIGGYRPSLRQLKAIGRVVLRGLEPLINQINQNETSSS